MRALTLHQPWASLMAWGLKTIETRSWKPPRWAHGWLAIHAGKNTDSLDDVELLVSAARHADPRHPAFARVPSPVEDEHMPLGAVVAVGLLADVLPSVELAARDLGTNGPLGNFEPYRYGWIFDRVIACPTPLPCRGAQGLWDVPPKVEEQLEALIAAAEHA